MLGTVAIVLLVKYTVHCIFMFLFHNCLLLPLVVNRDGILNTIVFLEKNCFFFCEFQTLKFMHTRLLLSYGAIFFRLSHVFVGFKAASNA